MRFLLAAACFVWSAADAFTDSGGWRRGNDALVGPCTIERRTLSELSVSEFAHAYKDSRPVVLTGLPLNAVFRAMTAKEELLDGWGDTVVTLSSANTYSYDKRDVLLRSYISNLQPQREEASGAETWYLFGDHNLTTWGRFLAHYEQHGRPFYAQRGDAVSLSFGISSAGTGVPFHVHGPAFSETVWGRKRWLLYAPAEKPAFDPDESTLLWTRRASAPLDCTVAAGEAIYIPHLWWHATLNADESVFISSFVNWASRPAEDLR